MNDRPREVLHQLLTRYGVELSDEPRRCAALLRDLCPNFGRETFALVQAAQSGVPAELRDGARHEATESLLNRLATRLSQNLGLSYSVSLWAVESWALALQIISPADLRMVCVCSACSASIVARKNLTGKRVKCPKCQAGFTVGGEKSDGIPTKKPALASKLSGQAPAASSTTPASQTATVVATPAVEFYLWIDSQQVGPYSLDQLLSYPMPPGVLVWRQGLASWTPGTDVPELAQHAAHSYSTAMVMSPTANMMQPSPSFIPNSPSNTSSPNLPGMGASFNPGEDSGWPVVVSAHHAGGMTTGTSRPHRGVLILVLGILSLVVCWPLGIVAAILGTQDLNAMQRGEMDRSGETMTRFGQILGFISLGIIALGIMAAVGQAGA